MGLSLQVMEMGFLVGYISKLILLTNVGLRSNLINGPKIISNLKSN